MNARPALLLLAITTLAAGTFFGCGPRADESPAGIDFDTTPPAVPDGIAATHRDDGTVFLSWRANRTDPDLAGYVVYRSTRIEGGFVPVITDPVRSNSFLDARPPGGSKVWYRIAARDAAANESAPSAPIAARGPRPAPTAATVLTAPAR